MREREQECELCGLVRTDVGERLTRLRRPNEQGEQYVSMVRCRDTFECRDRVEAQGGTWALSERAGGGGNPNPGHRVVTKLAPTEAFAQFPSVFPEQEEPAAPRRDEEPWF